MKMDLKQLMVQSLIILDQIPQENVCLELGTIQNRRSCK